MNDYFPEEESVISGTGGSVKEVLFTVAHRFRADNPAVEARYYLRSTGQCPISGDYMDQIRLHEKLPELEYEDYACAWAVMTPPAPGEFHFRFSAFGPVSVYVNGELQYRTSLEQERFPEQVGDMCLRLRDGVNSLMFQCIATPLGCGFTIGSSSYKGRRIQFFSPMEERRGVSGFVWSGPFHQPLVQVFGDLGRLPEPGDREGDTGVCWYPALKWEDEERKKTLAQRLFGDGEPGQEDQREMVAAAKIQAAQGGYIELRVKRGTVRSIYLDGKETGEEREDGRWTFAAEPGVHTIAIRGKNPEVAMEGADGAPVRPRCPVPAAFDGEEKGISWLYAGPLGPEDLLSEDEASRLFTFRKPATLGGRKTFWQVDLPGYYLRPFNEGTLYGEWNYPLGVTLYGLIETARVLNDQVLGDYVEGHMRKCCEWYDYCMWDRETYGAAPFHNQLTTIDSLDDCGSFGSALLEVMKDRQVPEGRRLADVVADHMINRQQRLLDGTYYRDHSYLPVMNQTLWADDLYMSVPFLCRYYRISGDEAYLEEAAGQAKRFFSYLFMPDTGVLSHIYDTRYRLQSKVPWGRGNGWVLFSLTELLAVMPETHREREGILAIYRTLCEGYGKLQDDEGMWHQVLTFPDSYRETSATAMIVCGFARGVRRGWLEEPEAYRLKAKKGWEALCRTAIDRKGNIYGVCKGSGYSFSKEYYARDLGWNKNDTHGVGIVLLAGIEVEKMEQARRDKDEIL